MPVEHEDEAIAMGELEERLADLFPTVSPEVVEAAVRMAHAELRGPIRDFVPMLVERAARERLARIVPSGDVIVPAGTAG